MKLQQAIVDYLQAQGLGTTGKDLFRAHMPAKVVSGSLVLTRTMIDDDPYSRLKKGSIQIISRDATADLAYERAAAIKSVLRLQGVVMGEVSFKFIIPKHEPLVFPRTDGGEFEASVNYQFVADNWE